MPFGSVSAGPVLPVHDDASRGVRRAARSERRGRPSAAPACLAASRNELQTQRSPAYHHHYHHHCNHAATHEDELNDQCADSLHVAKTVCCLFVSDKSFSISPQWPSEV